MGAVAKNEEGEILRRGRLGVAFALAALLAAIVGARAPAQDRPLPWAGGVAVVSSFEWYAGRVVSEAVGRPVDVICNGATDWSHLAAQQRFDPVPVWGYVLFTWDTEAEVFRPADSMQLSEAACWYLDRYWAAPTDEKGKTCRVATRIDFRQRTRKVKVVKRVKVRGRWVRRVVTATKTVQIPVQVPEFGTCPDYRNRVFALQSISHEAQHLTGVQEEAQAECRGLQRLAWFAEQFGATPEQGRQMAADYYHDFYLVKRPGTAYFLPGCPDPAGGGG